MFYKLFTGCRETFPLTPGRGQLRQVHAEVHVCFTLTTRGRALCDLSSPIHRLNQCTELEISLRRLNSTWWQQTDTRGSCTTLAWLCFVRTWLIFSTDDRSGPAKFIYRIHQHALHTLMSTSLQCRPLSDKWTCVNKFEHKYFSRGKQIPCNKELCQNRTWFNFSAQSHIFIRGIVPAELTSQDMPENQWLHDFMFGTQKTIHFSVCLSDVKGRQDKMALVQNFTQITFNTHFTSVYNVSKGKSVSGCSTFSNFLLHNSKIWNTTDSTNMPLEHTTPRYRNHKGSSLSRT